MKFNSLHYGKAMSAALFVLLLVVVGMKNALAQNQMATLQHNDTITGVFYGQNAFVSAYNAAVAGDVITLSSGTFNQCDISKSITIHGAGCVYDSETNVLPTIISGDFFFWCSNVRIEGVKFIGVITCTLNGPDLNNLSFDKCIINNINNNYNFHRNIMMEFQFTNCIINSFLSHNFRGTSIINSVVKYMGYDNPDIHNPNNIYNSVIVFDDQLPINNLVAYNSIIATVSGHSVSNCTFFNCIGIETGETSLFEGQITSNVMEVDSYEDVFEIFSGEVTNDNIYQLKEDIANTFLGNDGTEVGIYGGMMPYNPRPTYMIMKRCNVAPRSTIDNKLSVEIEVLTNDE